MLFGSTTVTYFVLCSLHFKGLYSFLIHCQLCSKVLNLGAGQFIAGETQTCPHPLLPREGADPQGKLMLPWQDIKTLLCTKHLVFLCCSLRFIAGLFKCSRQPGRGTWSQSTERTFAVSITCRALSSLISAHWSDHWWDQAFGTGLEQTQVCTKPVNSSSFWRCWPVTP